MEEFSDEPEESSFSMVSQEMTDRGDEFQNSKGIIFRATDMNFGDSYASLGIHRQSSHSSSESDSVAS
jgi:hypothetical protein